VVVSRGRACAAIALLRPSTPRRSKKPHTPTCPSMWELGPLVRPMIVCAVTLFPLSRNSPTIGQHFPPASSLEGDVLRPALHPAVFGGEPTRGRRTASSGSAARAVHDGCRYSLFVRSFRAVTHSDPPGRGRSRRTSTMMLKMTNKKAPKSVPPVHDRREYLSCLFHQRFRIEDADAFRFERAR